ncbi:CHAT domain-containing protein, partial [Moorena sp. SIO3I6]|uniref:CHAT domain-containing protein n=1 Tax=Moorena sp. SIO3I6 TaxID=2607831 RepID=UPI0013FB9295
FNPKAQPGQRLGKPHYAAYILHPQGKPQAIDLGEAESIDKEVKKFRKYLRNQVPVTQLTLSAKKLDELVMKRVRQLLGDTNNILLSPDATLNLVPFEALVDENDQYLVENYNFTYLTSGRDLLRLQIKYPSQQPPLVLADPLYKKPGEEDISQLFSELSFPPLEGTIKEAQAIQELLDIPNERVKTKKQATEKALKQVKSPSFLHIATHGFFLDPKESPLGETNVFDNPLLRSGLVFAGVEPRQSGGDDRIMTAYETTLLNLLGTKLVVLSACDTAVGDITSGEGIYGLRRALVIAGSESQVISLWKVSDTATKDLMVGYYKNLKAGQGRSQALHEIQRQMLQGELKGEDGRLYDHPYYWASFIPSGDWTPMEF